MPSPPPPRIIALANQKGGVGKTTTAVNLACALADLGEAVLLIDLDPQGNASTSLGIPRAQRRHGAYELLFGTLPLAEATRPTAIPNLAIVPASTDLSGAEVELVELDGRERFLTRALAGASGWRFILIDCPPSLSLLTLNALIAAERVLVPLQCEFLALEGLSLLLGTIERVKRAMNPGLDLHGVLLTMHDRRNNLSEQVAEDARRFFGARVYTTVIPRNIRIGEAPSHGLPVLRYDPRSPGARAYQELASEILAREARSAA